MWGNCPATKCPVKSGVPGYRRVTGPDETWLHRHHVQWLPGSRSSVGISADVVLSRLTTLAVDLESAHREVSVDGGAFRVAERATDARQHFVRSRLAGCVGLDLTVGPSQIVDLIPIETAPIWNCPVSGLNMPKPWQRTKPVSRAEKISRLKTLFRRLAAVGISSRG